MIDLKFKNKGFTLVELMVALAVVALGMLALGKFHIEFMRSTADANNRTEALHLAQRVEEDLRTYARLQPDSDASAANQVWKTTDKDQLAYSFINDNTGGELFQNVEPNDAGYYSIGEKEIRWEVTENNNVKDIDVFVRYFNEQDEETELLFNTSISAYDPDRLALVDDNGDAIAGGFTRNTQQTLLIGTSPEVIPVDTGDIDSDGDGTIDDSISRQTSRPTPDVSKKGGSVKTTFDVVTYLNSTRNADTNTADAFSLESFSTINCRCEFDKIQEAYTPSRVTWFQNENAVLGGLLGGRTGILKEKITGLSSPDNADFQQQDATCEICCRDHHDTVISETDTYPARSDADLDGEPDRVPGCNDPDEGCYVDSTREFLGSNNHKHYFHADTDDGPLTYDEKTTTGTYLEACRVREISGQERVMQDWRLIALDVIPDEFFDANGATAYSAYVTATIGSYVDGAVDLESFSEYLERTSGSYSGGYDIQGDINNVSLSARAIYVDYFPDSPLDGYENPITSSTELFKIPFYTVNITKLAGWSLEGENVPKESAWVDCAKQADSVCNSADWDYTKQHLETSKRNDPDACNVNTNNFCISDDAIVDELAYDDINYDRGTLYRGSGTVSVGAIIHRGNEGLVDKSPVTPETNGEVDYQWDFVNIKLN